MLCPVFECPYCMCEGVIGMCDSRHMHECKSAEVSVNTGDMFVVYKCEVCGYITRYIGCVYIVRDITNMSKCYYGQ